MFHQNFRNDHAPPKKIKMTMFHQNMTNDPVPPNRPRMTMLHQETNKVLNFSCFWLPGGWKFKKMNRRFRPKKFWWSMVIFEIPPNNENDHDPPTFEVIFIFWWSMVVFSNFDGTWSFCQILVEHGHFNFFGGARSFLKFWWNVVIFKFCWNTLIFWENSWLRTSGPKNQVFHQNLRNDHVSPKF